MSETSNSSAPGDIRLKGIGIALIGAGLMSLDPVFIRFSGVDELETSFLFGLFTTISMVAVIQLNDKRGVIQVLRDSGWPLLVAGLLMLGSASGLVAAPFGRVLSMVATRYATATEVSMTLMLETVLAPIWAFLFFAETPGMNSLAGGAIILFAITAYTLHLARRST